MPVNLMSEYKIGRVTKLIAEKAAEKGERARLAQLGRYWVILRCRDPTPENSRLISVVFALRCEFRHFNERRYTTSVRSISVVCNQYPCTDEAARSNGSRRGSRCVSLQAPSLFYAVAMVR